MLLLLPVFLQVNKQFSLESLSDVAQYDSTW